VSQNRPGERAPEVVPVTFHVIASDGYRLAARRYSVPEPRARIVMAGATGVPQGFYRRFASHAASAGFEVVTFDYRGIGDSAPATLRGFRMDYRDWGRLDLAAVVDETADDHLSTHLVAHSYGGQALGLLPDPSRLQSMHAFGTGTGWSGYMPRREQLRVRVLWDLAGPVVTRSAGYLAWSRLGLGEDLPLDVYRQWKRWCRYQHHYFEDPDISAEMVALFDRVEIPIVAINSTDDRWIPPVSRDAFMSFYRNAQITTRDIRPSDIGVTSLGHMGYFRQDATTLWDDVLADLTG
jgi:predicted alpha/beta hydrolase